MDTTEPTGSNPIAPRTAAFAQRMIDAKVPAARSWPHWHDFAAKLESSNAELLAALELARRDAGDTVSGINRAIAKARGAP
jgi:hypothetical protein